MSASVLPRGLGATGQRLWRAVVGVYTLRPDELALLEQACRTLDELAALTTALRGANPTVPGSAGQPVANPLFEESRRHRETLRRLTTQLGLPDAPGMPKTQPKGGRRGPVAS